MILISAVTLGTMFFGVVASGALVTMDTSNTTEQIKCPGSRSIARFCNQLDGEIYSCHQCGNTCLTTPDKLLVHHSMSMS